MPLVLLWSSHCHGNCPGKQGLWGEEDMQGDNLDFISSLWEEIFADNQTTGALKWKCLLTDKMLCILLFYFPSCKNNAEPLFKRLTFAADRS